MRWRRLADRSPGSRVRPDFSTGVDQLNPENSTRQECRTGKPAPDAKRQDPPAVFQNSRAGRSNYHKRPHAVLTAKLYRALPAAAADLLFPSGCLLINRRYVLAAESRMAPIRESVDYSLRQIRMSFRQGAWQGRNTRLRWPHTDRRQRRQADSRSEV